MSSHSLRDARVVPENHAASEHATLPLWADTYLSDHDPCVTDLGLVAHARSPQDALAADGVAMLHLVAEHDRIVPRSQSEAVAAMWGAPLVVVEGQGHQMGDAGWETSVMAPLRKFLDGL